MAKLFIFGIGGTGSRVIKSLVMLLAAGVKSHNTFEIVPIIIDPHKDNEDLKRTISILGNYQKITEKAGIINGFFGTKISTLESLDNDHSLSGSYTFELKEVSNSKFKDYFSYNSLSDENQDLADLIFSGKSINLHGEAVDLLDIQMDIGFVGNPNVGSVVLNQFKDSEEFKNFANNFNIGDRVFIISSIFGGTGAAGFPTILKNIRNAINITGITNQGFLQNSSIGALTVMPYFNIDGDEDSPIKKSDFIEKTKAALGYYQDNVNPTLNALYYIGDDYNGKPYTNDPGQGGQKNNAHFVELAGASAIIDFMNLPDYELETVNGKPRNNIFKEYGIKEDQQSLYFKHLGDQSSTILTKSLIQFTLFKKYLDEHFNEAIENKVWSTSAPLINKSFKNNQFYTSNLKGLMMQYEEWLKELDVNTRSFSPFNLNSDFVTLINGKEMKKSFLGLGKFNFDSFNTELNKIVRNNHYTSAEQKILDLFYKATEQIVTDKY